MSDLDAITGFEREMDGRHSSRMYAGKEATAEFGDYRSAEAVAHMANFCIGDLVEAPATVR